MSKHNRERRQAPPSSRVPVNMAGVAFFEIESLHVGSWCPLPDGKGEATQVHLHINVAGIPHPLVMRFKGPGTLDQFIDSLERHRADVWPTPG
jgi:hypothetical protein